MQRDLRALADGRFDLAVIGGGATGAFIAWEATLRGLRVALVEREDFAHATSATNSRLIHGGLRYLAQGQLGVVREAARERAYWLAAAPHLVRALPFLLPTDGLMARTKFALGLALYDRLGRVGDAPLPRARWVDERAARSLAPALGEGLDGGAFLYHDAQMHAPERLVLAALAGVAARGGAVANRLAATGVERRRDRVAGLRVRDREGAGTFELRASKVVNATGPWADEILGTPLPITRSAGIHLVLPPLSTRTAVAVKDAAGHLFILPWRGHTLVGTTDERYEGSPDDYRVTRADVASFVARVARAVPELGVRAEGVLHAYGGLRPLVAGSSSTYAASRRAELIDHARDGRAGLYTVVGGKWTTSRSLAERVLDRVAPARASASRDHPLPGAPDAPLDDWLAGLHATHAGLPRAHVAHLAGLYGAGTHALLEAIGDADPLPAREPLYAAQARLAATTEQCRSLADFVFRRTQIGLFGCPPHPTLEALAAALGGVLGWDAGRRRREVAAVEASYDLDR